MICPIVCGSDVAGSSHNYLNTPIHVEFVGEHVVVVANCGYGADDEVDVLRIRCVVVPLDGIVCIELEETYCIDVSFLVTTDEGNI